MTTAIGLDLSLTSPGICIIPLDWDCDMRRVQVAHFKTPEPDGTDYGRALRLRQLSHWIAKQLASIVGEIDCAIESLPTHNAFAIAPLAELHGVVRLHLLDELIETHIAPQSAARKLLLGALPKKDVKVIVAATVRSISGCASWTGDECDAFVVANWLLCELGAPFMTAGSGT